MCPVKAVLMYIVTRGFRDRPLFINLDGTPLTQQQLIGSLRNVLTNAGIDCTQYYGHSFRIGAATTAAAKGISDSTFKVFGRWSSDSYKRYIRLPHSELTHISSELIKD